MKKCKIMRSVILIICALVGIGMYAQPKVSIAKYAGNKAASISLTFDDGTRDHFTHITPQLNKYGLKGTFGINGNCIGDLDDGYAPRLSWDELREMDRQGHEINNHTWSHPNLYEHPEWTQVEFEKNDSAMIAELGHPAKSVLLPFNAYTTEVLSYCNSKYVGVRLSQFALGQHDSHATKESIAKWLQEVVNGGEWGVTMTHGIFKTWDYWHEPEVLWDFFRTLSEMKDTIWVGTFGDVQAYIKERDAVSISTQCADSAMSVKLCCPLPKHLFNYPLTLKIEDVPISGNVFIKQDGNELNYLVEEGALIVDVNPHGSEIVVSWK